MYNGVYFDYREDCIYVSDDEKGILQITNKPYVYKLSDRETNYKNMFGQNVEKTFYSEDINKYYEVDIRPEHRTILDNYKNDHSIAKNVICLFDLEVDSRGGYAKKNKFNKAITAITSCIDNKYTVFLYDDIKRDVNWSKEGVTFVRFTSESEMIEAWFEYLFQSGVTVLSAQNGDDFDMPYMVNRCKKIKVDYTNLSPIGKVYISKQGYIKIALVSHMDFMLVYKNPIFRNKLPSYSLESIGQHELGIGKVKHPGLDKLYVDDINEFLEYAYRDVWIMAEVEKKKQFILKSIAICNTVLIDYENSTKSSLITEGAILRYMRENNIVSINNHNRNNEKEEKSGAYVKEPNPKVYYNMIDLDYVSMYPSLLILLNVSTETKVAKVLNFDAVIDRWFEGEDAPIQLSDYDTTIDYTFHELRSWLTENNYLIACNGVIFDNNYEGIIPKVLKKWYIEKKDFSKLAEEYYNAGDKELGDEYALRTYISKILMNASYGTIGMSTSRYYDKEMVEAITVTGRYLLKYSAKSTSKYIQEKYNETIDRLVYAHTDSLFYTFEGIAKTTDETLAICAEVQKYINGDIGGWINQMLCQPVNDYMEMKQEIIAKSGIFLAKNRNALWVVWEKGVVKDNIQIKGISIISTSFPVAFKSVLKEAIYIILKESDDSESLNLLRDKVNDLFYNFKTNMPNNDIYDLGITKGVNDIEKWQRNNKWISGTPIQVSSAINYNTLLQTLGLDNTYKNIESGDKMKYVYLNTNKYRFKTIGYFDDIDPQVEEFIQEHISYDKTFNAELLNKIQDIYDAVGWKIGNFNNRAESNLF